MSVFTIKMGALSDSFGEQLTAQGVDFDEKIMAHFQKDSEAVTRLKIRGLLSPSGTREAEKKLFKKIQQHVDKVNNSKQDI